ncbi:phytoene desaturase family protein [Corynebacterium sp. HMSC074H12]|uniref:phytoene desaturase family protein n=1 Tax=Corynebacterium sp. HMSC074H12 TaxID=1739436 RepID=UPI0008D67DBD|nr:phytoene desaturase family protein [Corynebacterium sp. HMSC074H12]OFQ58039.1 phytoene dehydrogenase [Corynebacterium sp. HMSC074H12]
MGKRVVVIGAGIAGLATAALMLREGWDVVVVEKQRSVGGRAGVLEVDGFRFDTGPSWYLMPEAFDEFFRACGTSTERELDLVPLSPAYRVYNEDGAFLDVESGVEEVAHLFESIEPGAGERVRAYLARSSDVYAVALSSFLYTTFSRPTELLTREVLTRLGTLAMLLTRSLDRLVAAQFQDYRLRQVLTYPAVFLSTEPQAAPALYSLMSHTDLVEGVRYPQGGFAAVVAAIARQAEGATFLMGTAVTAIECTDGRTTGVRLDDGRFISAEAVVSAADLRHTETALLPEAARTYPESYFARRDPGLGTVLVFLGVRGELPQLEHHTLLFSKDWEPDFRAVYHGPEASRPLGASESIYVSKTSATDPDVAPEGCENLFVLVPVPAEEAFGHGSAYNDTESARVAAIADAAIHQLGTWLGIPDFAERIVVRRTVGPSDFAQRYNAWAGGAVGPAHTLQQSAFFRGRNVSRKLKNLFYAGGTTVPGVGVPMCLISAHNVLTRMREQR